MSEQLCFNPSKPQCCILCSIHEVNFGATL